MDLDARNQKERRHEVTLFTAPVSCFAAQPGISGSNVSCLQRGNDALSEARSAGWELEASGLLLKLQLSPLLVRPALQQLQ